jgi:ABC-type polysaccharide/polyol phosphate transport system ATPase subunit
VTLPREVAIHCEGVVKRYATREVSHAPGTPRGVRALAALDGVTLTVRRGTSLALLGPNGAGKTTLLRLIAGVARPTEGSVWVRGRVMAMLGPSAAFHLELSARENVALGSAFHGVGRRAALALVGPVLESAGLVEAADVAIKHMSEGMRFRLAFSLALHLPHEILLCDEAFAPADEAFRAQAYAEIRRRVEAGTTFVLATHEPSIAIALAETAVRIEAGRVVARGTPSALTPPGGDPKGPSQDGLGGGRSSVDVW